jgi:hypothetical protein
MLELHPLYCSLAMGVCNTSEDIYRSAEYLRALGSVLDKLVAGTDAAGECFAVHSSFPSCGDDGHCSVRQHRSLYDGMKKTPQSRQMFIVLKPGT